MSDLGMRSNVKHNFSSRKGLAYFKSHWQLYTMLLIPFVLIFVFSYLPMAGLSMAFMDFRPSLGLFSSELVGFKHFSRFFNSPSFVVMLRNTLLLSLYQLIYGFPFSIILAFGLNEMKNGLYKRSVQLITYAPYFISTVVMVSLVFQWTDLRIGIVNQIVNLFGGSSRNYMGDQNYFRSIYVLSGIWQFTGFNSIIYLAALNSVDPQLHEAAIVDGASRLKRVWHIDLPCIVPTIVILLIMNCGQLLNVGFEKVFLMQTPLNTPISEIITTYVYKVGIQQQSFSYGTAIGFFNSFTSLILITMVNTIAKKYGETSLW